MEVFHEDLSFGGEIKHPLDARAEAEVGQALVGAYPQHGWVVEADHRTGLVTIRCPDHYNLKFRKYAYVVDMAKVASASEMRKKAIMAGGELLERAHVSRTTGERMGSGVDLG